MSLDETFTGSWLRETKILEAEYDLRQDSKTANRQGREVRQDANEDLPKGTRLIIEIWVP